MSEVRTLKIDLIKDNTPASNEALLRLSVTEWHLAVSEARVIDSDFRPNLENADLSGLDLQAVYFDGACLRGANLTGTNLEGADLADADLQGANLEGANLKEAELYYADFDRANLKGVDLTGTSLHNASMVRADLTGAILTGTELHDVDLTEAYGVITVEKPDDGYAIHVFRNADGTPRIISGCRNFSVAEAFEHCALRKTDDNMPERVTRDLPRLVGALAYFASGNKLRNVSSIFAGVDATARNAAIQIAASSKSPLPFLARRKVKAQFGKLLPR